MRIGVVGSATVGKTLALGFKKHGHDVRIASRSPEKLSAFSAKEDIPSSTPRDAAAWAEVIVLAVKGDAAEAALNEAGPENLAGKPVIDTTNPIANEPPEDGVIRVFTSPNDSLMERLQRSYPDAHFVKAFNSIGAALMINPDFKGVKPTMFFCGDDGDAKRVATALIEQLGWEPADMGTAKAARAIEPLCQLWCIPGFRNNDWASHAFHVLRR
jgi:predicted dinucleotide-binding enzyme